MHANLLHFAEAITFAIGLFPAALLAIAALDHARRDSAVAAAAEDTPRAGRPAWTRPVRRAPRAAGVRRA